MSFSFFHKKKVQRLNWIKLFFFLSLLATFSFFLIKINNMFISVLLAVVLSQLVRPLVDRIEEWVGVTRFIATVVVFTLLGIALGALVVWMMPFLSDQFHVLKKDMPNYVEGAKKLMSQMEERAKLFLPVLENWNLSSRVQTFITVHTTQILKTLPKIITDSFSVFFLCPFIAFFMVKDSHSLHRGFLSLVPNHIFEMTVSLTHQISEQIGRFIRARLFEAFIIGLITSIGLSIISFPFPLLLGLFAGLMNLVPYVGPLIGFTPALLIGLVNDVSLVGLLSIAGVYIFAQLIDNVLLIPVLVARMMKLHPITVVVVVIAGAQFMGILGMIISIPVANAIQVTYHAIYQHIINAETTG